MERETPKLMTSELPLFHPGEWRSPPLLWGSRQGHVSGFSQIVGKSDVPLPSEALHCWYSVNCEGSTLYHLFPYSGTLGLPPEALIWLCSRIASEHHSGM